MSGRHCAEMLEALSDYLDGTAAAALCTEIERHLAKCPECTVFVDTLRKTIELYRREDQTGGLPAPVRQRLYRRLDLEIPRSGGA